MSGHLATMVGMLVRVTIFLVKRDARLGAGSIHETTGCPVDGCTCEHCCWVRGLEAEADEKLGGGWR